MLKQHRLSGTQENMFLNFVAIDWTFFHQIINLFQFNYFTMSISVMNYLKI